MSNVFPSRANDRETTRFTAGAGHRRLRPLILQAILLAVLACFIAFIVFNVVANVQRLNLHLGFGFLWRDAGFAIAQTPIPYPDDATYLRAFLVAFLNTLIVSAVAIVLSTLLGFVIALARLSKNPLLAGVALAYVEAVRNIPLLLQLFFWYFAVLGPLPAPGSSLSLFGSIFLNKRGLSFPAPLAEPGLPVFAGLTVLSFVACFLFARAALRYRVDKGQPAPARIALALAFLVLPFAAAALFGVPIGWEPPQRSSFNILGGISLIPEFVAMAVGLSIYGAAFTAEILRGGIITVRTGQAEAGFALGLSRWIVYRRIVIPLAMRTIIPPLSGQYISLMKNSSLAAAIGYPDLMLVFAGTALNQSGQPLEIMFITMMSYLFLSLCLSSVGNVVNRRLRLVER